MVFFHTLRFVCADLGFSILYFPVWWYSRGLQAAAAAVWERIRSLGHTLNLRILLHYLFQPMYGYRDFWSRVISLYVRLADFAVRLFLGVLGAVVYSALLLLWVIAPPAVIVAIVYQLGLL